MVYESHYDFAAAETKTPAEFRAMYDVYETNRHDLRVKLRRITMKPEFTGAAG